ncbi:MAG: hypothetical protein FWD13_03450 [Treponema sp.]|nr:hypothetical protein [Treponema sp.]
MPNMSLQQNIAYYKLYGTTSTVFGAKGILLKTFQGDLNNVTILLRAVIWNFTLYAYDKDNNLILIGTRHNVDITGHSANVSFNLLPISNSDYDGIASIIIELPNDINVFSVETIIDGVVLDPPLEIEDDKVKYHKELPVGEYLIHFLLKDENNRILAVISEMVVIRSHFESVKNIILTKEDFNIPHTPVNLRVTDITTISISLAWDAVGIANSYKVYRSDSDNGTYDEIAVVNGAIFTDTDVVPDTGYYYKVSSIHDGVESSKSNAVAVITIPSFFTNLRVTSVTDVSVSLTWETHTRASSYNIYRSDEENGTYVRINQNVVNETEYIDISILQDSIYYYRVNPVFEHFEGILSNPVSSIGFIVPGNSLVEKLTWISNNVISYNKYLIEIDKNETISPQTLSYSGKHDIIIIMKGKDQMRNISLSTQGPLLKVNENVTLILYDNITLNGIEDNSYSLIHINNGTLIMNNNVKIINNTGGCGVRVEGDSGGNFIMNGGEISGNTLYSNNYAVLGGGVYVSDGVFTMNNGKISGNSVNSNFYAVGGGGISILNGTFIMNGGEIYGNNANSSYIAYGGGVYLSNAIFSMNDGIISGNTANTWNSFSSSAAYGGGVYVGNSTFTMNGGEIFGNTAVANVSTHNASGGGIFLTTNSNFYMSNGIIYGSNASQTILRNTARLGAALLRLGTAQYGIFNGNTFIPSGNLTTTDSTIRVVNGILYTE